MPKNIELKVTYWTTDLEEPGQCWDHGKVRVLANDTHEIPSQPAQFFNHPADLQDAIDKALAGAGVTVYPSTKRTR
jgi:hypothetical protein